MKTCSKCRKTLALEMFYKHPYDRFGVQNRCKECHKAAMRARTYERAVRRMADGLTKLRGRPGGNLKHGHKRERWTSPEYQSWSAMRSRCRNPNDTDYHRYGGRGIVVCERWSTFEPFLHDMGPRPEGKTLDRIDSNGNYEPGNCRWATHKEQRANQRRCAP